MRRIAAGFGLILTLIAGFASPAAAEFFGCDDQHPSRYSSYSRHSTYARSPFTHEFAAQASRNRYQSSRSSSIDSRRYVNERSRW